MKKTETPSANNDSELFKYKLFFSNGNNKLDDKTMGSEKYNKEKEKKELKWSKELAKVGESINIYFRKKQRKTLKTSEIFIFYRSIKGTKIFRNGLKTMIQKETQRRKEKK